VILSWQPNTSGSVEQRTSEQGKRGRGIVTEELKTVHEEMKELEDQANTLLMNDLGFDAVALELRALRYQMGLINLTLEEIRDGIHETAEINSKTIAKAIVDSM